MVAFALDFIVGKIVYESEVGFKDGKFDGDKVGVMEGFFDTSFHCW